MDQKIQKKGLINFLLLLVAALSSFAVGRYGHLLAGQVSVIFLGLGVLVAAVSWFQMRLEESERLEKLEFDELAKSASRSALFNAADAEVFPAQRARQQFERIVVPGFTVILFLAQAGGAYWAWRWLEKITVLPLKQPLVALGLYAFFFLFLFLFGKFSAGIARLEGQRLLRPGAGHLLLNAYLCFVVAGSIAAVEAGFPKVDLYVARVLCGLLTLIAVETAINLVLEIYRPRVKGKVERPLYESRLVGLLSQPEGLITTAAQALDYQFGFKVSETWFYKTLAEKLPAFVLGLVGVLLFSTCIIFLEPGEQGLLERFGKPVTNRPVLNSGPHLKFPWPIDSVYRFRTREIHSLNVGFVPDPQREKERTVLWTVPHYKTEFNLLVASREPLAGTSTNQAAGERAVPVNLLTVSIPVQYQIADVRAWAYNHEDPTNLLEELATREVVLYLVGVDLIDIMSTGREKAAAELRDRIQARAEELKLGVNILLVGLQDVHPPVKVADAYQAVVGALQQVQTNILAAEGYRAKTLPLARAEAQKMVREAEADALRRTIGATAQAAQFTNQMAAYAASPDVYPQRLYLQTLARASGTTRKYIIAPTNTTEVIQLDLQDKLRPDLLDVTVPPAGK
ncbi:MAG: protease modulator HflK [Verrucomicrobia bacterium]|nr:protease modulator HflK [Verrucomicrobiota bacterium]